MIGNLCRLAGIVWVCGALMCANAEGRTAAEIVDDPWLAVTVWDRVLSAE